MMFPMDRLTTPEPSGTKRPARTTTPATSVGVGQENSPYNMSASSHGGKRAAGPCSPLLDSTNPVVLSATMGKLSALGAHASWKLTPPPNNRPQKRCRAGSQESGPEVEDGWSNSTPTPMPTPMAAEKVAQADALGTHRSASRRRNSAPALSDLTTDKRRKSGGCGSSSFVRAPKKALRFGTRINGVLMLVSARPLCGRDGPAEVVVSSASGASTLVRTTVDQSATVDDLVDGLTDLMMR